MPIQDSNHNRRITRNRSKEGISPVIATVILIAIAVVLGVAVASYAGGLFSTQSGTGGINVRLMSMSVDNTGKLTGSLFIDNQGARADQIVSIEIPGHGSTLGADEIGVDTDNNGCTVGDSETIPGNTTNLAACFEGTNFGTLQPGQTVTVRIGLRSGTVITQSVTVQG
jgi:flagellin-like protein